MNPTETLRHEHDTILLVLDAAERQVQAQRDSGRLDTDRVERMLDFFRNFADKCHHMKEEQQLFVRMAERGIPFQGGPLSVMVTEHELGRHLLRETAAGVTLARAGSRKAYQQIADNLAEYVDLLRAHIRKENEVLFPLAEQVLSLSDMVELTHAFDRIEEEEIGPDVHERYHKMAHELVE